MISLGQASNYSWSQVFRHLFAQGKKTDSTALRKSLAGKYRVQIEDVALYHSGRSALSMAFRTILPDGGPVIIPGLTCIAVVRAIREAACTEVFADIEPQDLSYNLSNLEQTLSKLSKNTPKPQHDIDKNDKVCYNGIIMIQNTLGLPCNVAKIERLANKYNFAIVEDLAHCAGRFYSDGREVGTVGQAVALSFGKGKAIDTINGGAAVLRISNNLAQPQRLPSRAERWRDRWYPFLASISRATWRIGLGKVLMAIFVKFGWVQRSADTALDTEVRLTDWQAKLAAAQLAKLPKTPLREFMLVNNRKKLLDNLAKAGYNFSEIWYDTPVSPARYANEAKFPAKNCPQTVQIAQQIINLPTWYPEAKLAKARSIITAHQEGKNE